MEGLTRNEHWFTDLTYVPMVWAAPDLAGFKNDPAATKICRAFSLTALGYSLLTDAKWGAIKVIPYGVHAALDLGAGVAALAVPLLVESVGRNNKARNTFIAMGLTGLVVGIFSLIGANSERDW